jgi:hypothetical protein
VGGNTIVGFFLLFRWGRMYLGRDSSRLVVRSRDSYVERFDGIRCEFTLGR